MTFFAISALINAITSSILGFFVIYKKRSRLNINFSLFCLSVAFWSFSYFLWQISNNEASAILWSKILTIGSILIPLFYLRFTLVFLDLDKERFHKILLKFGYFLAFFFLVISPTSLLVDGVSKKLEFQFWPNPGSLYWLFLLMFISFASYSVILFFKFNGKVLGVKRGQIKFLLLGTGLGFLGGSTNFLLWYDIPIPPYGNVLVAFYVFFTTYAIIAHHLMDIKLVIRKSSVYLLSILTIILFVVAINYNIINEPVTGFSVFADLGILILAILIFPYIKNYFYRFANKYFFSSLYDSREVIGDISDKLRTTLEAQKIYEYIHNSLDNAFHFKSFAILSHDEETNCYIIQYNKGFNPGRRKGFFGNEDLDKMLIGQNKSIIIDEMKNEANKKNTKETINLLTKLGVDIMSPLNIKDKTVGAIILGPKESGDMYNDEDIQVLEIVSAQAAISMENALLYEESLNFNIKLKKEIDDATLELRIANNELKKLDVAKSEFISIASHQLRTPLTVIKGYISMILEGSFGEITPNQKDSLEKVFESGERLIQLVENLLNVSRIESGRMEFDFELMNLEDIVDSVIDEFTSTIKKKGLRLNYEKPAKPLPKAKIDQEKMRQVILNLIDNAVKYTKKGSITINFKKDNTSAGSMKGKNISFCVSDSGMGIGEDELPNLFKKFSRGKGTSIIHTEGTGLGLYVAREMVEAHKGKIWAESKGEGQGSKFCFTLPMGK